MYKNKICIIDDNVEIINTIKFILDKEYKIIPFTRGLPALKYLSKNYVDLVLLDIILPDINGFELLPQIIENNKDLKVIVITALNDLPTAATAMKNNAFNFLSKPFNKDELISLVENSLNVRKGKTSQTLSYDIEYTGIIRVC